MTHQLRTRHFPKNLFALLTVFLALFPLTACGTGGATQDSRTAQPGIPAAQRGGKTEVIIIGMIHGGHRTARNYPLSRIETVVRAIAPDLVLTEIPPDRIDAALQSWRDTGRVTEQRTRAFPEYTDVIIPLQAELGFAMKGTAAWTPEIAASRRAKLQTIEADPDRADQWAAWQVSQAQFRATLDGRGSDPLYIHTTEYDVAVEARYQPYIRYFDPEIGAGGWEAINRGHWANIAAELDAVSGQGKRVLITYGGFHKYWILRQLAERDDVIVTPARDYFLLAPS
ncbi:MAG: hypothetical protein AAFX04_02360 [Pseudomonadota bacterium]